MKRTHCGGFEERGDSYGPLLPNMPKLPLVCIQGPKRPHKHKDPTFWFQDAIQGDIRNHGLWDPYVYEIFWALALDTLPSLCHMETGLLNSFTKLEFLHDPVYAIQPQFLQLWYMGHAGFLPSTVPLAQIHSYTTDVQEMCTASTVPFARIHSYTTDVQKMCTAPHYLRTTVF